MLFDSKIKSRDAKGAFKRYVQVGRVVLLTEGKDSGKLAVIVEIIDHNRALIENPSSTTPVPRQAYSYRRLLLTPLVLSIPRAIGSAGLKKAWEKSDIPSKWESSTWAKKRLAQEKRKNMTDFERFEVRLLKKQRQGLIGAGLKKK
ncbi:ribosomal protein [Atractiella rhizophila]|nr:ribosomal protein [Atractiella rhizophila]